MLQSHMHAFALFPAWYWFHTVLHTLHLHIRQGSRRHNWANAKSRKDRPKWARRNCPRNCAWRVAWATSSSVAISWWKGPTPTIKCARERSNPSVVECVYAAQGSMVDKHRETPAPSHPSPQDSNKSTPLMNAVYAGHLDVVMLLVKKGAKINLQNNQGKTALAFAYERKHKQVRNFGRGATAR